jgi:hypothetical protein
MRLFGASIILFVAVLGTGCAAHVQETVSKQTTLRQEHTSNIYLSVSGQPAVVASDGYESSIEELLNVLSEKIKTAIPSARVENGDASVSHTQGLKAKLTIEDFRYVSGFGRFMTGIMVGKARLQVRVELIELGTNQKIGESSFGTSSQTKEGILGGTTSRQIEAVADSIVAMISKNTK